MSSPAPAPKASISTGSRLKSGAKVAFIVLFAALVIGPFFYGVSATAIGNAMTLLFFLAVGLIIRFFVRRSKSRSASKESQTS